MIYDNISSDFSSPVLRVVLFLGAWSYTITKNGYERDNESDKGQRHQSDKICPKLVQIFTAVDEAVHRTKCFAESIGVEWRIGAKYTC